MQSRKIAHLFVVALFRYMCIDKNVLIVVVRPQKNTPLVENNIIFMK